MYVMQDVFSQRTELVQLFSCMTMWSMHNHQSARPKWFLNGRITQHRDHCMVIIMKTTTQSN